MLSRLEGFVAIAEHGQIGRAAAALHLTQPSLTARLQRLEAELGMPLYRRTRQGMVLTPQGEALLPHARRALEAVADGRRALDGSAPTPGRLALGAAPAVSTYVLPALLERLGREYPSIALSVRTGRSEEVLEMVLAGEAQIGLVRALRHPAIEAIPFYQEELVLVTSPDHPLAIDGEVRIEQLGGEELVLFDRSSSYHELTGALFRAAGVVPRGVMELDNIDAAKQMVRRGLGVALLPHTAVAGELADGLLGAATIVGAPAVRRQIVAIRRRGAGPPEPLEAAFLAALPDAAPPRALCDDAGMIDQGVFRSVMAAYPTGVTIVTAGAGDVLCGMAANSFTSVSLEPPLVLVCSQLETRTLDAAKRSGRFAIHMLGSNQVHAVRSFVGRDAARFEEIPYELDDHGTPILDEWIALLVCRLDRIVGAGDHEIMIGEVERCERRVHAPLLFHDSKFHELPALPGIPMKPPLLNEDELLDLSDPFVRVLMPGR